MMQLRPLGDFHLLVTPIGLGLAALGRPGYINLGHADDLGEEYDVSAMETHTHMVLDEAWKLGIRYFDAARSYGLAEQFLGSWLRERGIPHDQVTVGSKWGYTYTADWKVDAPQHEVKQHDLDVLARQWQESRANLDGYLELYQIHSATLESGVLDNQQVLDELARLKSGGVAIGLTLSGANQPEVLWKALEISVEGVRLFDTVQATWNLLETSAGSALLAAHQAGMGVIVKEALANGRLTPRNQEPDFAEKFATLNYHARRLHTSLDALALAAVLSQPWCDLVLSGAATVDQLRSNVKAVETNYDKEAVQELARLAEPPEIYWEIRSSLKWN